MGATEKRIIEDHLVTRTPGDARDDTSHRKRHAAQVHRDVRGLRAQRTIDIEHRAGEVQAVADIGENAALRSTSPISPHTASRRLAKIFRAGWSHRLGNGIRRMAALIQLRRKPKGQLPARTVGVAGPAGFSTGFFYFPAETRLKVRRPAVPRIPAPERGTRFRT